MVGHPDDYPAGHHPCSYLKRTGVLCGKLNALGWPYCRRHMGAREYTPCPCNCGRMIQKANPLQRVPLMCTRCDSAGAAIKYTEARKRRAESYYGELQWESQRYPPVELAPEQAEAIARDREVVVAAADEPTEEEAGMAAYIDGLLEE